MKLKPLPAILKKPAPKPKKKKIAVKEVPPPEVEIFVVLDLSVTSPGIAFFHVPRSKWCYYGFEQDNASRHMLCAGSHLSFQHPLTRHEAHFHVWPALPSKQEANNLQRYLCIWQGIDTVLTHVCELVQNDLSKIWISAEDYAPEAQKGDGYKLCELRGVVWHNVFEKHHLDLHFLPIGQWKKEAIGHGFSTKWQVAQKIMTDFPQWNLGEWFQLPLSETYLLAPIPDWCDCTGMILTWWKRQCPLLLLAVPMLHAAGDPVHAPVVQPKNPIVAKKKPSQPTHPPTKLCNLKAFLKQVEEIQCDFSSAKKTKFQ